MSILNRIKIRFFLIVFFLISCISIISPINKPVFIPRTDAKPNPVAQAVADKIGFKIDPDDPRDKKGRTVGLDQYFAVNEENPNEKASYNKVKYMDGCMPQGNAKYNNSYGEPDGIITINEMFYYLFHVARFDEESPLHNKYAEIRAVYDRAIAENDIINPLADDADQTLYKGLVDNLPVLAIQEKFDGKAFSTILQERCPAEQKEKLAELLAVMKTQPQPTVLLDHTNRESELVKQKEELFGLMKDLLTDEEKVALLEAFVVKDEYLGYEYGDFELTKAAWEKEIYAQTAVDLYKINQYTGDTKRMGTCGDIAILASSLADIFEANVATVSMTYNDSKGETSYHICNFIPGLDQVINYIDLSNNPEYNDNEIYPQNYLKKTFDSNYILISSFYVNRNFEYSSVTSFSGGDGVRLHNTYLSKALNFNINTEDLYSHTLQSLLYYYFYDDVAIKDFFSKCSLLQINPNLSFREIYQIFKKIFPENSILTNTARQYDCLISE